MRGAALLDRAGPADWRSLVDADRLNLDEPGDCILGQVFGDFVSGLVALQLSPKLIYDHGFVFDAERRFYWMVEIKDGYLA